MARYAIINLMKTPASGPIHVSAVSDSAEALKGIATGADEVVMVFEEDGHIYYSRDLESPAKTFKGSADALAGADKVGGWVYDDGGRADAGFKGTTGDCCCRAISIATGKPYREVYDLINEYGKRERIGKRKKSKSSARTGVYKKTARKILEDMGWTWVPCMTIGSGCTVHLTAEELPAGRIICAVSKHYVAVIDGVIHDTYDCTRDGTRCVYGYYVNKAEANGKNKKA
jgi:hypothetical protein